MKILFTLGNFRVSFTYQMSQKKFTNTVSYGIKVCDGYSNQSVDLSNQSKDNSDEKILVAKSINLKTKGFKLASDRFCMGIENSTF